MAVIGDRAYWQAESNGLEVLRTTIGDLLDKQAERYADKEAVVYAYPELGLDLRWTYRQYRDQVDRVAHALLAIGIARGEHVAIWAPNVPEWILLQLATARIGAILVTINTALRAAEVEYVLRQADVSTLFLVEEVRGYSYLETLYGLVPELKLMVDPAHATLSSTALPRLRRAVLIGKERRSGVLAFEDLMSLGERTSTSELRARQAEVAPEDTALIMYT